MRSRRLLRAVFCAATLVIAGPTLPPVPSAAAFQGPEQDSEFGPVFLLSLGGKLYDDLWGELGREPPVGRNPAIPSQVRMATRETWRCVTCHGWDYSGATLGGKVFPGLRGLAGTDPGTIKQRIRDPSHPFPAQELPDLGVDLLAFFISEGLYDPADYLDERGRAVGNQSFGQEIFEGACITCHQIDGRRYLKGERGDRSSLGWVVRNRPKQALHKILNGVPTAEMLSLRFLSKDQIADLVAYLQALDPTEK